MSDKSKKKQSDGITETIDLLNKINELQEANEACIELLDGTEHGDTLKTVSEHLSNVSESILELTQQLMDSKYKHNKIEREKMEENNHEGNFSPVMVSSPSLDLR